MRKESHSSSFTRNSLRSNSGQGTTEMIFLLPLFAVLAAGAISITYMCWQGLKVQQAANAAARVAGQEMVSGAKDNATLLQDNGLLTSLGVQAQGDADPDQQCGSISDPSAKDDCYKNLKPTSIGQTSGVYWKYRDMVRNLFNSGEKDHLFVQSPIVNDYVSQVVIKRVMRPPTVFGWKMPTVTVQSTAYGGEDSFMYGLPKFGRTSPTDPIGKTFWKDTLTSLGTNPQIKNDKTGE